MTTKIPFTLLMVDDHTPLVQDPFYKWLDANHSKGSGKRDIDVKLEYLTSLGFIQGMHSLSEEQMKTLKYIMEIWYRCTPQTREVIPFEDLFTLNPNGFWVNGMRGHWGISLKLRKLIEESRVIYGIFPHNYFFEIINGNQLHIKYQQTLGGRYLCNLKVDWIS